MVERVEVTRFYDTQDVVTATQMELTEQYENGEIDEEEYVQKMSQTTTEDVKEDVEKAKARKYEQLQEDFINDEITEAEMEEAMDDLFKSGDGFLEREPVDEEDVKEDLLEGAGSEARFRAKEVGQIAAFLALTGLTAYAFLLTKGAILLPLLGLAIVTLLAYNRFKGKI